MPQTRSRHVSDAPPRRKAASRAPPQPHDVTYWSEADGLALVGKAISVLWPSDGTYYPALVVGFHPRARRHKLIYLEDESVESADLGIGPTQRDFRLADPATDPLVGKTIRFLPDAKPPKPSWFDFMRDPKEKTTHKFCVIVFAKIDYEPQENEVCSPAPPKGDDTPNLYYRVIYLANEYLATVDLAHVQYIVETPPQHPEDPVMEGLPNRSAAGPKSAPSQKPTRSALADDDDADPEYAADSPDKALDDTAGDDYEPSKDEELQDSDADMRDDPDSTRKKTVAAEFERVTDAAEEAGARENVVSPGVVAGKRADRKYRASGTKDLVVDAMREVVADKKNVSVDADPDAKGEPGTSVEVTPDDSPNAVPLENAGSKARGEGSVGTQETRDDPLDSGTPGKKSGKSSRPVPASLYPPLFEDEEGGDNDTASDDEKLGWPTENKGEEEFKSQVGDYITLDLGDGNEPRKAFVEAYLPGLDKHFIAFCDAKGGNLKVKLTRSNHTVLADHEVHVLSRTPIAKEEPAPLAGRTKRRRNVLTLTDNRPKKKTETRSPPIKGDSAGPEICGRCLKIVWPESELMYTALVLGYNPEKNEHLVVYLSDHCVEVVQLKYREWTLLSREDEPWITQGMLGNRLYVLWSGEYESADITRKSRDIFGDECKVVYEAYVLSYEGEGRYLILYPSTEDTEVRELHMDDKERDEQSPLEREWGVLGAGVNEIAGLPVVGWEP